LNLIVLFPEQSPKNNKTLQYFGSQWFAFLHLPPPKLDSSASIGLEDGNFLPEIGMTIGEYDKEIL